MDGEMKLGHNNPCASTSTNMLFITGKNKSKGRKLFKCDICNYTTHRCGDYKRHMIVHSGEKPFRCEECDFRTAQAGSLKIHMRKHTGEKPYR